jgi:ribonuclease J
LVKKTLEEKKTVNRLKYKIVNPDMDLVKIGCFEIEFVRVNHNIPETFALSINTPK